MKIRQLQLCKPLLAPVGRVGEKSLSIPKTVFKGPQSLMDCEMEMLPWGGVKLVTQGVTIIFGVNSYELALVDEEKANAKTAPKKA